MDGATTPPPLPQPINMKPRWIGWVVASALLPALPWLVLGKKGTDADAPIALMFLAIALIAQLITSIMVSIGISQRRSLGVGGIVGLSIVFLLASLAIGTAVFFVACISVASLDFK